MIDQSDVELRRLHEELRLRELDVDRLNRELDETNRDVLALYAELDEKALDLARASELKSQFLSNISHEFRTPLNSIAIKFTERGEVRVSAEAVPDGCVAFTVSDTGIGIAPDDQARIFEEFSQVDNPLQARAVGTGLGLPLSRKLAELLGGSLSLESTVGVGSTFRAVMPVRYIEPAPLSRPSQPREAQRV